MRRATQADPIRRGRWQKAEGWRGAEFVQAAGQWRRSLFGAITSLIISDDLATFVDLRGIDSNTPRRINCRVLAVAINEAVFGYAGLVISNYLSSVVDAVGDGDDSPRKVDNGVDALAEKEGLYAAGGQVETPDHLSVVVDAADIGV